MDHENNNPYTDLPTSHDPSSTVSITMSSLASLSEPSDGPLPPYPFTPTPAGRPYLQCRKYTVSRRFPRERHDDHPSCPIASC